MTAAVTGKETTRFGVRPGTISLKIREPGAALTHFAALILLLTGTGPLLMRTKETGASAGRIGMLIFAAAACFMYAASTVYHTAVAGERLTTILRKIDHSAISVMIAGTYTPICLKLLPGKTGTALLAVVWLMAAGGILIKLLWVTCPKALSSVLYLSMGWLCVFAMKTIYEAIPLPGFLWLLAGGIFYSVGALIYASRPEKFDRKHVYFGSHEIFHVFIMLGTFCHYVMLYRYC
ncbi:MAG: hemolysin III family protein [Lachnospiraceae bacterium]|nr:hemolysin III family protein [Lachnospiraceae bacterium]